MDSTAGRDYIPPANLPTRQPRRRLALVGCGALALALIAPVAAGDGGAGVPMLKGIASRVTDRTGIVTIEATAPVPYVATQPDPRTFVVELREVVALGFADKFKADPRHPVSAVHVEHGRAFDGT